ncbi:alpha/beta hydrolase [Abyssibius alkaniclasticus]|uniref:alpha/beta hydrolase n=1 Tax=Abyssibius alkaniclasticus TaxID=2881234 RepID=UPI00236323C9|nr:alpha/beta hydrolase [Abyssibius alkaniclasticus]UPH72284.1 alpha/beta hydrolase [Abyssibius alkaniclasticus]
MGYSAVNRRYFLASASAFALAGCAERGAFLPVPYVAGDSVQPIFLATDRKVDAQLNPGDGRGDAPAFGRVDVRIPAAHEVGQVELPLAGRDNSDRLGVLETRRYDTMASFLAQVTATGSARDEVQIFVHGYNYTLAEVVYRHAQMAFDYQIPGPQISYSWASAATAVGYLEDRDSVAISRDGLEALLTALARSERRKIRILAHSMGCLLVMETLRQMAIGGNTAAFSRLSDVILMSPDINLELFESQIARLGRFPAQLWVLVAQNDLVLQLSERISGNRARLGRVTDFSRLQQMGVNVVDLSSFEDSDLGNHAVAMSSPQVIALFRGLLGSDFRNSPARRVPGIAEIAFPASSSS